MRRMDGWLLAGLILVIIALGVGCASALDNAIKTANIAGTTAIAAHEEIRIMCMAAEERADTIDKANVVIETCAKAEDAYGTFRASWLALASAIRVAQLTGSAPSNMGELLSEMATAAARVEELLASIKELAK